MQIYIKKYEKNIMDIINDFIIFKCTYHFTESNAFLISDLHNPSSIPISSFNYFIGISIPSLILETKSLTVAYLEQYVLYAFETFFFKFSNSFSPTTGFPSNYLSSN
jgi:hypothetical protein